MTAHHTNPAVEESEQQNAISAPPALMEMLEFLHGARHMRSAPGHSMGETWYKQALASLAFRNMESTLAVFKSLESTKGDYLTNLASHHLLNSPIGTGSAVTEDDKDIRSENERLRFQVGELRSQVEMLKSRVAQERQGAAKAIRLHDQLLAHHDATENKLLDHLAQRDMANNAIRTALIGKADGRLCMAESYRGEVVHVSDTRVDVVFLIGEELVEQKYDCRQFFDGQLPKKGDQLDACVCIAKSAPEQRKAVSSNDTNGSRKPRKNVVPLPRTF